MTWPVLRPASVQLGKLIGAKWKELSKEEKKPYEDMAEKDKVRQCSSGVCGLPGLSGSLFPWLSLLQFIPQWSCLRVGQQELLNDCFKELLDVHLLCTLYSLAAGNGLTVRLQPCLTALASLPPPVPGLQARAEKEKKEYESKKKSAGSSEDEAEAPEESEGDEGGDDDDDDE